MDELPLFEEEAERVEAGELSRADLELKLRALEERLLSYASLPSGAIKSCLDTLQGFRQDPRPGNGRDLDAACRLAQDAVCSGGHEARARPSLPALIALLESCEELEPALEFLVQGELHLALLDLSQPTHTPSWSQGLRRLHDTLASILAEEIPPLEGASELQSLHDELDKLWQKEVQAAFTSGPTRWPALNAVLQMGRALQAGQVPAVSLGELINSLLDAVDTLEENAKGLVAAQESQGAQGSARSAQLAVHLTEQLHALNQGALRVLMELEEGQSLANVWAKVEATALAVDQAVTDFLQAADDIGKTPCMRCGGLNPSQRSHCQKCGAILPRDLQAVESAYNVAEERAGDNVGGNLQALLDAVDEAMLDPESLPQLEEAVNAFDLLLRRAQKANLESLSDSEEKEYREILSVIDQGLELLEEGTPDALKEGRRLLLLAQERALPLQSPE